MGIYLEKSMQYLRKEGCSDSAVDLVRSFLDGKAALIRDSDSTPTNIDQANFAMNMEKECGCLATMAPTPPVLEYLGGSNEEQEKEKTMTLDLQQAEFFRGIIREKKYEKLAALRKQFGLENDDYPMSAQELVNRIAAGKFILNPETKDTTQYSKGDVLRNITWRDPAIKKDQAGYDAAEKALGEAYLTAKMAIMTNPAAGADAVAKFAAA